MASGKEGEVSRNQGYISDESDFYGDPTTKESFEDRAADFDDRAYWKQHQPSLIEKADANVAQSLASPPPKVNLYNPYAGQACAWQLDESVGAFLQRLPPSTTPLSESIPWIYIANPFQKAPEGIAVNGEAPPSEDSNWARCVTRGHRLLEELTTLRNTIEKENAGKDLNIISHLVKKEKDIIVQKILDTAIECRCTSGKWMIFCDSSEVNEVWAAIAKSTSTNSLGIAAKVAPNDASGLSRTTHVICIYTENFSDKMDVYRVLKAIKELVLVNRTRTGAIHYKCDVYTHLELNSSNQYNIKASLYSSLELLKNPPHNQLITNIPKVRPIKKEEMQK
ncbi:hypothetical protein SBOR_1765 [Sclerotinia borealis F-4128]|uniref:DUF1917-domain-containing protein n=1 Tax=Sclerotinia borealis (strain F-4128) TaxID=1432307 RepID=W9CTJ7_SCLBF|nr:hypothetical protein SBOR_1765 [Sclerotinia borealis F-4128]